MDTHCPSCGLHALQGGNDYNGPPTPTRQGGCEHICWKCYGMLNERFIRQIKIPFKALMMALYFKCNPNTSYNMYRYIKYNLLLPTG